MEGAEYRRVLNGLMSTLVNSVKDGDLIEELNCMIMVFEDSTGEIVGVNDKFCKYLGYSRNELIGKVCFEMVVDLSKTLKAFEEFRDGKKRPTFFHNHYRSKSGESKDMYWVTDEANSTNIKGYTYGMAFENLDI